MINSLIGNIESNKSLKKSLESSVISSVNSSVISSAISVNQEQENSEMLNSQEINNMIQSIQTSLKKINENENAESNAEIIEKLKNLIPPPGKVFLPSAGNTKITEKINAKIAKLKAMFVSAGKGSIVNKQDISGNHQKPVEQPTSDNPGNQQTPAPVELVEPVKQPTSENNKKCDHEKINIENPTKEFCKNFNENRDFFDEMFKENSNIECNQK